MSSIVVCGVMDIPGDNVSGPEAVLGDKVKASVDGTRILYEFRRCRFMSGVAAPM